jgi:hypothetical protein
MLIGPVAFMLSGRPPLLVIDEEKVLVVAALLQMCREEEAKHLRGREMIILPGTQPTPQVFLHPMRHLGEHIVLMDSPHKVFNDLSAGIRVKQ